MSIDWDKLKELVKIFDNSRAKELEVKKENWKVFLKKPQQKLKEKLHSEQTGAKLVVVTSPKEGVFYRKRPSEDSPWVEQGERVEKGDRLGFVDSLGIGHEIKAEQEGIVNFNVEDGARVEQDKELLVLQPVSSEKD